MATPPPRPARVSGSRLSLATLLDAVFALYRQHFRRLCAAVLGVALLPLIGTFAMSGLDEWLATAPVGLGGALLLVEHLRFGIGGRELAQSVVLYLLIQTLAMGVVIPIAAEACLRRFATASPPQHVGLRGDFRLVAGVLVALPVGLLSAAVAQALPTLALLGELVVGGRFDAAMLPVAARITAPRLALCAALVCAVARLLLAPQAMLLERLGPLAALERSWRLTRGAAGVATGAFLLLAALAGLFAGLPAALLHAAPLSDAARGLLGGGLERALGALSLTFQLVALPLPLILATVLYFQLRFRHEGYDLELSSRGAGVA